MKKISIIFIFCLFGIYAKSQEWAPVGAAWHYTEYFFMPVTVDEDYIRFESVKDTLYHGVMCRKITKYHNVSCTDRPMVEYMYSQNGKVYFWDEHFGMFQELYDFSPVVGNSWKILVASMSSAQVDTTTVKVDSANLAVISGLSLNRLFVTYDFRHQGAQPLIYQGTIIQDIGDLFFMFNYAPYWTYVCDGDMSGGLRCYQDASVGLYQTGIAPSCTYVHELSGIANKNGSLPIFTITPNPADRYIRVTTRLSGAIGYTISDMSGRVVMSGNLTQPVIETASLQPGFYQVAFYVQGVPVPEVNRLLISR